MALLSIFPNLQKHVTNLEILKYQAFIPNLQMQFASIIDSTTKHLFSRFTDFRLFEETAKFMKCADSVTLDKLNLKKLEWIDLNNSEMQLTDLQSSSV